MQVQVQVQVPVVSPACQEGGAARVKCGSVCRTAKQKATEPFKSWDDVAAVAGGIADLSGTFALGVHSFSVFLTLSGLTASHILVIRVPSLRNKGTSVAAMHAVGTHDACSMHLATLFRFSPHASYRTSVLASAFTPYGHKA